MLGEREEEEGSRRIQGDVSGQRRERGESQRVLYAGLAFGLLGAQMSIGTTPSQDLFVTFFVLLREQSRRDDILHSCGRRKLLKALDMCHYCLAFVINSALCYLSVC